LECCKEFGVKNLIFSSSCSVYGNVAELPVTEETPLSKVESPYAPTKQVGEEIIQSFSKVTAEVNNIALRYFNPVGAHESGLNGEDQINKPNNLVPIITMTAAGKLPKVTVFGNDYNTRDGSCVRDYIHVSDIADAHVKAMQYLLDRKNESNYELYNLGTGNGVTVLEAIHAFEKVSGEKLQYEIGPRRAGDVAAIYSNSEKALQQLGWKADKDIQEMMSSAWAWQKNLDKES
jgi:UDP-glucose 4-epimerase